MINVFGRPIGAPSHLTRLVLLSALSVALMMLDHRGHHLEKIRAGLNTLAYPIQLIAATPAYVVGGLADFFTTRGTLLDTTPELFDTHIAVNLRGPFFAMQAAVADMVERGTAGSIVNILSQSAHVGQSFLVPYSASKAALANLTKNVAQSFRAQRIRCNGVMAGWMDTPGEHAIQKRAHDAPDDWLAKAEAARPMGQLIKPDELAGLVSYMLSPESGVMTGALVDYDQWVPGAQPE